MKSINHETPGNVVQRIAGMRRELTDRFTVIRIGIFGSFARGDAGPESDVDIIQVCTRMLARSTDSGTGKTRKKRKE